MPRWTSAENRALRQEVDALVEKQQRERRSELREEEEFFRDHDPRLRSDFDSARSGREDGVR